jgi:hypothetical protein
VLGRLTAGVVADAPDQAGQDRERDVQHPGTLTAAAFLLRFT